MTTEVTSGIVPNVGYALTLIIPIQDPEPLTFKMAGKFAELIQLFDSKQKDYGSDNIAKFGRMGVGVRMNDKWERILNLTKNFSNIGDPAFQNESLRDSYNDLAIYAMIDALLEDGAWE